MNFRSALEGMGHEVVPFDFMARESAVGRSEMRRELIAAAGESDPDLLFFFLSEDQLDPATIRASGSAAAAPTMNWFADDHWRFDELSRTYAPAFDWVVTTHHESVPRYERLGHPGVILSQWACNQYAYDRTASELEYDVTFVGIRYGERPQTIARLAAAGYSVRCWGRGWPDGRLSHDEMVRVFGASRINLNLSSSWEPPLSMKLRAALRGRRYGRRSSQIKGRTFEVPGSGGFLLTDRAPHLEEYFEVGREIAAFSSDDDLIEQVGFWLEHPEERAAVAEAGYRRARAEHTYDHRFAEIFRRAGLG